MSRDGMHSLEACVHGSHRKGNRLHAWEKGRSGGQARKEKVPDKEYILLPLLNTCPGVPSSHEEDKSSPKDDADKKSTAEPTCVEGGKIDDLGCLDQQMKSTDDSKNTNSINSFNTVSPTVNASSNKDGTFQRTIGEWDFSTPITINAASSSFSPPAALDDFSKMPNLEDTVIFDDAYNDRDEGAEANYNNLEIVIPVSPIPSIRIHKDHPKEQIIREVNSVVQTRKMAKQNEAGKRSIGTKWVYRNKRDQRGIVVRNKARLVTQGHRQEEGIDYDKVFAPVARIEAIRLFLAYASFIDFTVYQMDVKSAFLYGTIKEEVYISQPPGFVDPEFPNRVYKVEKALYGLHQAPRAWLSREKMAYFSVRTNILKKFGYSSVKTASTSMETHKPLSKDADGTYVDVHLYRSINGSLMYLTSSRPDIMFVMYACSRFQVQPKVSHMHAVKRIFRYLKGQPTLGLWYPKDLPLELIAYSNSDYAGASLDRKSTTRGCQFLGSRLIFWQCEKQTIMANSITEAEYITKIHVDNESSICVVKNHVYHSKTKHIEIMHHFIRDSYEKRLIEMVKIHTDHNVTDLLTKAFDVTRIECKSSQVMKIGLELKGYLLNASYANLVQHAEKSDNNPEFHQIVDFLPSCSISYALTVSPTIYASYIEQFWNTISSKTINFVKQIHVIVDGKAVVISESSVRSDLLFDNEDDEVVHKEEGDRVERATTTDASLEAAQDGDNILKTQTTAMPNVDIPQGMDTCGSPKRQETIGGTSAQTRSERVLEQPSEPPLTESHTSGSGEGRMEHPFELTDIGRIIEEMDKDEDVNLVSEQGEVQEIVKPSKDDDDATLIKTLLNIKRSLAKDKGKGIMQETELPKKLKKKEMIQLSLDEELAQKLYAEELAKQAASQEQERVWDQVHTFVPKDSKIEKAVMKRAGFNLQQEISKKQRLDRETEQIEETNEEVKA
nr:hypothetical protein [Tanacetum cinerariifolium]